MPNALTDRIRGLYAMTQNALASNPYLSQMDPRDTANALATAQSEAVAGIGSNMLPGVGDLVGLAQDANMYWSDPASRRARNYLLTGLGALPFLPALASVGRQTRNVPTSFGNEAGMVTYHGSPHDFDRFDMSKIGTGEGAQAYGHGLYVAESPKVARQYAENLQTVTVDGKALDMDSVSQSGWHSNNQSAWAAKEIAEKGYDRVLADAEAAVKADKWDVYAAQWLDEVKALAGKQAKVNKHLYTVDLPDEHIAKMLDWDAPLSEQPEVLAALEQSDQFGKGSIGWRGAPVGMWERNLGRRTGEEIYRDLTGMGWTQQQASAYLRSLGIPGIKYLDGGSRTAGQGTRNFVVFDDNLLKILSKE